MVAVESIRTVMSKQFRSTLRDLTHDGDCFYRGHFFPGSVVCLFQMHMLESVRTPDARIMGGFSRQS